VHQKENAKNLLHSGQLKKKHRRNLGPTAYVREVPVSPHFGLMGTVPLTFQDEKVKNLLSPAVNRSDLRGD